MNPLLNTNRFRIVPEGGNYLSAETNDENMVYNKLHKQIDELTQKLLVQIGTNNAFHGVLYGNVDAEVIFLRNLLIQYVLLRIIVHYRTHSVSLCVTKHTGSKSWLKKSPLHQHFRTKPGEINNKYSVRLKKCTAHNIRSFINVNLAKFSNSDQELLS